MAEKPQTSVLLNKQEAADRLNCGLAAINNLIKSGKLHAVNIGAGAKYKTHRISEAEIERFISEGSNKPTKPIIKRNKPRRRPKEYIK